MTELLHLFLRTVIIYAFLIAVMKIGGKRQIGELQLSELITALLISEIAANPIQNPSTPLLHAVIPVLSVIFLEILLTYATTKSRGLKRLLDGTPDVIIDRGKLNIKKLGKLRMTVEELICECRQAGISDIGEVWYAILEENGKFSFFEKAKKGEKEKGIAHTLITDGEISQTGLTAAGMTEAQLNALLTANNLTAKEVFLLTVNDACDTHIVKKPSNK